MRFLGFEGRRLGDTNGDNKIDTATHATLRGITLTLQAIHHA